MQQAPVGDVLNQLQRILGQQPPGTSGQLVTIGGPTLLAGGNAIVSTGSASSAVWQTSTSSTPKAPPKASYSYKVKTINPVKKSDVIVHHLNECSVRFESVNALRVKLIESFQDNVPKTIVLMWDTLKAASRQKYSSKQCIRSTHMVEQ